MRCRIEIGLLVLTAFSSTSLRAIPPQTAPEIKALIGQRLILVGYGSKAEISYSTPSVLGKPAPGCDRPVEIRKASYSGNQLRIDVEEIGTLQLPSHSTAGQIAPCRGGSETTRLSIRKVSPDAVAATLHLVLEYVLVSPEDYLKSHGVKLDFPPDAGDEMPVSAAPARGAPLSPKTLLMVQPSYSNEARKARLQGAITVAFVVGSDGRVRSPRIVKGLGSGLDEQALRVLPMWRFEPVQLNSKPVAVSSTAVITFHLY